MGKKWETMKITYLTLIAGLSTGFVVPAQPVMAQHGQHRFGQQFHQHGQHHRERERNRTNGSTKEREREKPNGVVQEQRQEQRTDAAGQTQTRSEERTTPPR